MGTALPQYTVHAGGCTINPTLNTLGDNIVYILWWYKHNFPLNRMLKCPFGPVFGVSHSADKMK